MGSSFRSALLMLFAAIAFVLLIACGNVANLLLARAAGRRGEVAVRSALGARPSSVVNEVVQRGLKIAAAGIVVGGIAAFGTTRVLSNLLFGVGPRDPYAFLLTSLFLLAGVVLASWIPAHQAARVDPSTALRSDR
ncbi:MAG: FtsX-like permease family protein [Gemmatimonadota bacterium]|nr:FtsX-like permease family protein [Gemmatimonadota bacterium]